MKSEEMDKTYQQGYEKIPEDIVVGKAQASIISETVPGESW